MKKRRCAGGGTSIRASAWIKPEAARIDRTDGSVQILLSQRVRKVRFSPPRQRPKKTRASALAGKRFARLWGIYIKKFR
jgi:hypothetical protein